MENIEKNNKLIAEFMGGKMVLENHYGINIIKMPHNKDYDLSFLKYNTSWDWLMPVVEKIKSVTQEPEDLNELKDTLWWGSIEDVYDEVVVVITMINSGEIEIAE